MGNGNNDGSETVTGGAEISTSAKAGKAKNRAAQSEMREKTGYDMRQAFRFE
jgi:hypothetical protein